MRCRLIKYTTDCPFLLDGPKGKIADAQPDGVDANGKWKIIRGAGGGVLSGEKPENGSRSMASWHEENKSGAGDGEAKTR